MAAVRALGTQAEAREVSQVVVIHSCTAQPCHCCKIPSKKWFFWCSGADRLLVLQSLPYPPPKERRKNQGVSGQKLFLETILTFRTNSIRMLITLMIKLAHPQPPTNQAA